MSSWRLLGWYRFDYHPNDVTLWLKGMSITAFREHESGVFQAVIDSERTIFTFRVRS